MVAIDARDFLNAVTTIHLASTSTVYPGYPCTDKVRHVSDNGSGTVSIMHEVCTTSIPTVTHTSYATIGGKCTIKGPEKVQTVKVGDDGHGNDIQQIIENDVTRTTTSFVGQITAFVCVTLGPKEDDNGVKPEEVQDDPPPPPPAPASTNSVEGTSTASTNSVEGTSTASTTTVDTTTPEPPAPPPTDSIGKTSQQATATRSGKGETTKTITRTVPKPSTTTFTAANSDVIREIVSYFSVVGGDGEVGTTTYYETISHYQATKTQVTTTQVSESASRPKQPPRPKSSSKVQEPITTRTRKPDTSKVEKSSTELTRRPSARPTQRPTGKPTAKPTSKPTAKFTSKPAAKPTSKPTAKSTSKPTPARPTKRPSRSSSRKPSTKKLSTRRHSTHRKGVKTETVTRCCLGTTTVSGRPSTLTTHVKPTKQTTKVRPTKQTTKPKPTMQTTKAKPTRQTTKAKPTTLTTSAKPSQQPGGDRCQDQLEKDNKLFRLRTHISGKGSTEFENLYVEEAKYDGPNAVPTLSYDRPKGGKFFFDVDTTSVLLSHEQCKYSGVTMYRDSDQDAYSSVFISKDVGTHRMRVTWGSFWWDNDRFDGWVVCRASGKGGKRYELKWHDAINSMPIDTSKCAKVDLLTESV
ncbi:Transcriptional regulatory protein AlgP [Lasiodiplodia theobromae]|uniref:Transcriptional regulatory protein AlgP n=1 Tax=Lasiodiplodia theobromae TaxID=45133 RepID=A0A5N5DF96_9PEZI|nr:Transcriptional regulatory protein AlgP [Lasiodiplodia theobromae]